MGVLPKGVTTLLKHLIEQRVGVEHGCINAIDLPVCERPLTTFDFLHKRDFQKDVVVVAYCTREGVVEYDKLPCINSAISLAAKQVK